VVEKRIVKERGWAAPEWMGGLMPVNDLPCQPSGNCPKGGEKRHGNGQKKGVQGGAESEPQIGVRVRKKVKNIKTSERAWGCETVENGP